MLLKDYSVCFIINTNAHICVVRLIYIFSYKWDTYEFQALSLSALGSSKLTAMRSLSSLIVHEANPKFLTSLHPSRNKAFLVPN